MNLFVKAALMSSFFCSFSTCYGLYNGNPSSPEMPENGCCFPNDYFLGIKAGYLGDLVFSRSMVVRSRHTEASNEISSFKSVMNAGMITLDFMNRVDLYTAIGSYHLQLSQRTGPDSRIHYKSDHHLAGMAGLKGILVCWGDTQLGLDVKGFVSYPHLDSIRFNDSYVDTGNSKCRDTQWQIGTGLSQRMDWFIPYIGVTYTHSRLKLYSLSSLQEFYPRKNVLLSNKYSFGFVLGFGISLDSTLAVNVEARVIEETAGSCSVDFRF
ncbi:MAG: hypothetical protein NT065_02085 [Chlamydiae bacterium]|nr:hypothetical protein [Chlamydiota bacterium]